MGDECFSTEISKTSSPSSFLEKWRITLTPMTMNMAMIRHSTLRVETVASCFGPNICTASATEKSAILGSNVSKRVNEDDGGWDDVRPDQ